MLLAEVARRASGRPFDGLLSEEIFRRAGLEATTVLDEAADPVPGRAAGWAPTDGGGFRIVDYRAVDVGGFVAPLRLTTVGAGGLVSTAADLDRWARAFFGGDLVADSLVRTATRAHVEVGPSDSTVPELVGYGYGWYVSRRYGDRVVWHDGDFVGFRTLLLHVPAYDFTLTLLANRRDLDQRALAVRIADRFLAAR